MNKRSRNLLLAAALVLTNLVNGAEKPKAVAPAEPFQTGRPSLKERPVGDKAIIFTVADALGFVRWTPPRQTTDTLNRLQWLGSGTQVEAGKTYTISRYSYALSLSLNGAREDIQRVGPNGASQRLVQAYLGQAAWDETAPGVGAKAVDAGQARERRLRFLRTPFGFTKALLKADASMVKITDPGAGGVIRIALTVDGTTVAATLDAYYRPASISTRVDGQVVEVQYGRYQSINEYGVMFATRVTEKLNGQTRLTLNINDARVASYLILQPPAAAGNP
jgi:hypothetical protein